jgi:putative ABC transport system substrate-binding protein
MAQGGAVVVISKLNLPVPVVYVFSGDPVVAGLADSLARPRGNMTGMTFMAADINGKRLQLLRDFIPTLSRVAVIANPTHPGEHVERDFTQDSGRKLGLTINYYRTRNREELDTAFAEMAADPPPAILLLSDGFAIQNRHAIVEFGMKHRAPVVSGWPVFATAGALLTYGPSLTDRYRRLASYADRILKGARPADIPIEQPTTFEMVVNVKTAKALGLSVPAAILAAADTVIE